MRPSLSYFIPHVKCPMGLFPVRGSMIGYILGFFPRPRGPDSGHMVSLVLCPQFHGGRSKEAIGKAGASSGVRAQTCPCVWDAPMCSNAALDATQVHQPTCNTGPSTCLLQRSTLIDMGTHFPLAIVWIKLACFFFVVVVVRAEVSLSFLKFSFFFQF